MRKLSLLIPQYGNLQSKYLMGDILLNHIWNVQKEEQCGKARGGGNGAKMKIDFTHNEIMTD